MIIELVVLLIVIGLAFWVLRALSGALAIPPPIVTVIQVILVVIVVLYLLQVMLGSGDGSLPNLLRR